MGYLCQTFRQEKDWKVKGIKKSPNILVKDSQFHTFRKKKNLENKRCRLSELVFSGICPNTHVHVPVV